MALTTRPEYGAETTATEVAIALGPHIQGKTVIVTGVSPASIGYSTAASIASQAPAMLILASRTQEKVDRVVADIASLYPDVHVKAILLDLASPSSIRAAAARIGSQVRHIDILINNAGVSTSERLPLAAPDGTVVDTQFFTNHLGVFLLTALLLPQLRRAAELAFEAEKPKGTTRIANLSSQGHRLSPMRFSDYGFYKNIYDVSEDEQPSRSVPACFLETIDGYPGFLAYGQSKTANILHASELSRRLRQAGDDIVAVSVHPGTIETELSRSLKKTGVETIAKTAPKGVWKTQDQGSATTIVAAFDPKLGMAAVGDETVGYLSDCQVRDDLVGPHASQAPAAKRLWEESERLLQFSAGL